MTPYTLCNHNSQENVNGHWQCKSCGHRTGHAWRATAGGYAVGTTDYTKAEQEAERQRMRERFL